MVETEVDKILDTQDAATYWEEVYYTPDTSIVVVEEVADTRTSQVPSVGTSKAEEAKH